MAYSCFLPFAMLISVEKHCFYIRFMTKGEAETMRGIFIVILCLCSSVELFAAKVKNRKTGDTFPVKITASWENGNGVRKLYDTPLGAVYSFHLSAPALENKFGF